MDIPISTRKGCPARQIQYVQEGAMYECNQFEYRAAIHYIQLVDEIAKYEYDHCEYRATHKGNLACHIQSIHEGAKYECSQCDYGAAEKDILYTN